LPLRQIKTVTEAMASRHYPDQAPPPTASVTTEFRRQDVQTDGHLGPVSWKDPKTGTMLWMLLATYLAPILIPLLIALLYALGMTWAVHP
jgi:hypothetical protein